jgi:hypothetical protein
MTVEPRSDERPFPFQDPREPRYARISVGRLPTELRTIRYQLLGGATPGLRADAGVSVAQRSLNLGTAPGTHERRDGTHHSRSWRALDCGHVRDLVMSLSRTSRHHSAPE